MSNKAKMTKKEAATYLDISERTLERIVAEGGLSYLQEKEGKRLYLETAAVVNYKYRNEHNLVLRNVVSQIFAENDSICSEECDCSTLEGIRSTYLNKIGADVIIELQTKPVVGPIRRYFKRIDYRDCNYVQGTDCHAASLLALQSVVAEQNGVMEILDARGGNPRFPEESALTRPEDRKMKKELVEFAYAWYHDNGAFEKKLREVDFASACDTDLGKFIVVDKKCLYAMYGQNGTTGSEVNAYIAIAINP